MSSTMQSKLQFEVILSQTYSLFSLKLRIFGRNNFEQLFLLVFKRMLANKGKIRPAFYYLVLLIMFNFESHIQIDINIESLINEVSNNDIHEIINKNKSSLMTTACVMQCGCWDRDGAAGLGLDIGRTGGSSESESTSLRLE